MNTKIAVTISVASGLLLGVSINYPNSLWFLSLISIIPFLYVLDRFVANLKQAFLFGWLFGSVFLGTVLIWFWYTLPLDWLGVNNILIEFSVVLFSWVSLSVVLALFFGLTFLLFFKYRQRNLYDVFLITFIWVLFEYLRMWGYALLTLGSESLFGPHFSIGFVGYALAGNQFLLKLSGVGGVYSLSVIVVAINGILFWLLFQSGYSTRKKIDTGLTLVFILIVISSVLLHAPIVYEDNSRVVKVAAVHTNFPSVTGVANNKIEVVKELFKNIRDSEENPKIIVLPEDIRFLTTLKRNGELNSFMDGIFVDTEVLIIDSSRMYDEFGNVKSRVYYYNTKTRESVTDEKQFLMPYGEYTPYLYKFLLTILGQSETVDKLDHVRGYTKGDQEREVGEYANIKIGALFCSEILSPSLYKKFTDEYDVDILINLSSQSWFHGSKVLYNQTQSMAKIHAVQNRRAFVQSGNMSPAFVLNSIGGMVVESGWSGTPVIYSDISI